MSKSQARLSSGGAGLLKGTSKMGEKWVIEDVNDTVSTVSHKHGKERKMPRLDAHSSNIRIGPSSIAFWKLNESLLDGNFVLNKAK
jgi:hypothetical protein